MFEKGLNQIAEIIGEELMPFLDGVRTKRAVYELFKQAYTDGQDRLNRAVDIVGALLRARIFKPTNEFVEDLMELFIYLGLVESLGNNIVDIIVLLLVANGKDFHIECRHTTPRIKHVVSIKDLEDERVPLTTKLNFLKDNGVMELASIIDSELRNAIAHLRFEVRQDGIVRRPDMAPFGKEIIYIKGKRASEFALNSSNKLLFAAETTLDLLDQLAKEKGFNLSNGKRAEKPSF